MCNEAKTMSETTKLIRLTETVHGAG